MKVTQEGVWLLGSLLAGMLVVSGNAESWSLIGQPESWSALAARGLWVGTVLYLIGLAARVCFRRWDRRS